MINLLFGGDYIPSKHKENELSEELYLLFKGADYIILNLETTLTTSDIKIKKTGLNFKRKPEQIKKAKDAGVNALTLANNHINDFGEKGILDTLETCHKFEIKTIGAGKNKKEASSPLRIKLEGKLVSIINTCENEFNGATDNTSGAHVFDLIDLYSQIQREKDESDVIIVVYHGGIEYVEYPSPMIVKVFKHLVDIGVDCVVSHHTHYYSGAITYKNKPIIFGLGNFYKETSKKNPNERLNLGLIAEVTIDKKNNINYSLIPTQQNNQLKTVDLCDETKKKEVLNDIKSISAIIENEGELLNYWERYFEKESEKIINLIFSRSKLIYKIKKRISFLNKPPHYNSMVLLNLIQCDSHKYKITKVLNSIYKKDRK